jgi:transcriptional regulator of acetoin/glycerol metabolism
MTLEEIKRTAVADALERSGNRPWFAARELGIGRTTIYRLIKKWGLDPKVAGGKGSDE